MKIIFYCDFKRYFLCLDIFTMIEVLMCMTTEDCMFTFRDPMDRQLCLTFISMDLLVSHLYEYLFKF